MRDTLSHSHVHATMKRAVFFVLLLAAGNLPAKGSTPAEREILAAAHAYYLKVHAGQTVAMPAESAKAVNRAMSRLMAVSGMPMTPYEIRAIKEDSLNATTTVGPYFTITQNLLVVVAEKAAVMANKADQPRGKEFYREQLIAGILAHELGHFLAGHGLAALTQIQAEAKSLKLALTRSQQDEFEADRIGYRLMQAAGYGGENLYDTLRLLHDELQKVCSAEDGKSDRCRSFSYADSHPALHARLALFKNTNTKFHEEMLKLELAVASVSAGINLKAALETIDEELHKNAQNTYFLKLRAYALHKLWLESVPIAEQQLRAILSVPAFQDKMASGRRASAMAAAIPGDKVLYQRAHAAYTRALELAQPDYFRSASLVLMAYNAEERPVALQLSRQLSEKSAELAVLNNHAVIEYLAGDRAKAAMLLATLAASVDREYRTLATAENRVDTALVTALQENIHRMQVFDKGFVPTEFTPLLNAALIAAADGSGSAPKLARHYLTNYDHNSDWARRLAALAGEKLPERKVTRESLFRRLNLIDPAQAKLPPGTRTQRTADGTAVYVYESKTRVIDSAAGVRGITVMSGSTLKIDGKIGIGTPRSEVEKLWGHPQRIADGYTLYGDSIIIGVRYENDRVSEIQLSGE